MSSDSGVNAALLNLCAQLQDSGSRTTAATQGPSPASTQLAALPAPAAPSSRTAEANSTQQSAARPASDYEWLRSALASVEAPEKRVKQLLFHMENRNGEGKPSPLDSEDRLEALTELSDMVEDVNWAAEFALMQGPQRTLQVLQREQTAHPLTSDEGGAARRERDAPQEASAEVAESTGKRASAAELSIQTELSMIVAHSAQLNEPLQAAYQAAHWEGTLLPFVTGCVKAVQAAMHADTQSEGGDVTSAESTAVKRSTSVMRLLAALLHACSCLCRDCPPNTIVFIQCGGLAVLADVLNLARLLPTWVTARASTSAADDTEATVVTTVGGAIDVRTAQHINNAGSAKDAADEEDLYAPLLSVTRKVAARTCFFAAYLASTGVSSEDVIQVTCQLAEAPSSDEAVQKAAARLLVALVVKSPKAIKEAPRRLMPHRLAEWRVGLQRSEGDDAEVDERRHFVDALDEIS